MRQPIDRLDHSSIAHRLSSLALPVAHLLRRALLHRWLAPVLAVRVAVRLAALGSMRTGRAADRRLAEIFFACGALGGPPAVARSVVAAGGCGCDWSVFGDFC